MRRLPTASSLPRAMVCAASCTLPQTGETGSSYSRLGTEVHGFLELARERGREAALAAIAEQASPEAFAIAEEIDMQQVPPGAPEVALAWDPTTGKGRELGRGLSRDYSSAKPTEYVGTADLVALADDYVLVEDLKTGWSRRPPPRDNWQLKALGLFAARAYGRERAVIRLRYVGEEGRVYVQEAALDALDLDEIAVALDRLSVVVLEDDPAPVEGPHCEHCKAFPECPAKRTLALALGGAPDKLLTLTPDVAGAAWERIKAAREVLDRVQEAVEIMARQEPIPLPSGGVLTTQQKSRDTIDGDVAHAALAAELGETFAAKACAFSASKKSIKAAAGKDKALAERALEAVEKAGGVKTTTTVAVVEKAARGEKEAA